MRTVTLDEHAQFNKECRIDLYKKATFWAAIGGIGPVAYFLNHNVLRTPEPIGRTFTGYEPNPEPMGGYDVRYDYHFASSGDEVLNIAGFLLGVVAAIGIALLFYCIARFIADPIMYQIDLNTEEYSNKQLWLKRLVMTFVVLLYCGTMVFAFEYDAYPKDQYICLSDGQGNEYRVDKEEYEKYNKKAESIENNQKEDMKTDEDSNETKETRTKDKADLSKTPVERGYPSNDLEYYIDHPDEPMPQELAEELMAPDSYSPGMDHDPETDR